MQVTNGAKGSEYWLPGFGFDSGPNLQEWICAKRQFKNYSVDDIDKTVYTVDMCIHVCKIVHKCINACNMYVYYIHFWLQRNAIDPQIEYQP